MEGYFISLNGKHRHSAARSALLEAYSHDVVDAMPPMLTAIAAFLRTAGRLLGNSRALISSGSRVWVNRLFQLVNAIFKPRNLLLKPIHALFVFVVAAVDIAANDDHEYTATGKDCAEDPHPQILHPRSYSHRSVADRLYVQNISTSYLLSPKCRQIEGRGIAFGSSDVLRQDVGAVGAGFYM
jgi:hypothetical protein